MSILHTIVEAKKREVEERKALYPTTLLEKSIYFDSHPVSLSAYLNRADKLGVIAEIKRKSPSEGDINPYIDVEHLSIGYMQAGASALSVLTDTDFFGGSNDDLKTARKFNYCPILRKDFTIDEYQVIEAKSIGADAILLIASALTPNDTARLARLARQVGLEVLLEVHHLEELKTHLNEDVSIIGVNNRDLTTFDVSIQTSITMAEHIPSNLTKISESGISSPESIRELVAAGYDGFLIGSHFMRHADPHLACAAFIKEARHLISTQPA